MASSKELSPKTHILSIPFRLQGLNPALQFSKLLAFNGLKVTVLTTSSTISTSPNANIASSIKTFQGSVSRKLEKIVNKFASSGYPLKVIAYDANIPWVLELSHKYGIKGAAIYTESCSVSSVYHHFQNGTLKIRGEEGGRRVVELPCLPEMEIDDLPSFVAYRDSYPSLLEFVLLRNLNYGKADWLYFNIEGSVPH